MRAPLVLHDPVHAARVRRVLDGVRATCDVKARRDADPVSFVHAFATREDRELAGLLAACLAFGNVTTIRNKLADIRARLGPSLTRAAASLPGLQKKLAGFVHRVFRADDVARLLHGARRCQDIHGSLEATFRAGYPSERAATADDTWEALACFVDAIRREGPLPRTSPEGFRGPAHLLPDVRSGAGAKRLFLFLRWMVRPADGVDLGVWSLSPSLLFCPVDTHILKLGRNLGLTLRADAGATTVREITAALALFDARDPIKYDFSLCHLGMATRCREAYEPTVCDGCPARSACRHAPVESVASHAMKKGPRRERAPDPPEPRAENAPFARQTPQRPRNAPRAESSRR